MTKENKQRIPNKGNITDEGFIELLRTMWTIRLFEEKVESLYFQGEIHGTLHLCIGQEATAVGSACLLTKNDWIVSTHRNHGHAIAKGTNIRKMFAEIMGRDTGTSHGKGGSMHISDKEVGNLGSNGIVGAGFPIASGAALTAQMRGTDQVVICYSGDGATNEGSFHEALNLASIWHLPVIFFIENNQYGMSSAIQEMMNIEKISERSKSYGISGVTIDGNDLVQVIDTTAEAIERCRKGQGPTLIEAVTYRHKGHSKSDDLSYREEEESNRWKTTWDPIMKMETLLNEKNLFSSVQVEEMKQQITKELDGYIDSVKLDKRPSIEQLYADVYET